MERVAFLIESTGERIACLLNPETIVVRRTAGVKPRRSSGGFLTGAAMTDDPLLYVGGGTTEIDLDLLFDVTIDGSASPDSSLAGPTLGTSNGQLADTGLTDSSTADVRLLTRPLQQMTELSPPGSTGNLAAPPIIRLIWGKGWNVPGVIVAIAENFDYFAANGLPQRSWLRMRMRRIAPTSTGNTTDSATAPALPEMDIPLPKVDSENLVAYEMPGSGASLNADPADSPPAGQRLDEIAQQHFGSADAWRFLAAFNNLDDPSKIPAGTTLQIPPRSAWSGT